MKQQKQDAQFAELAQLFDEVLEGLNIDYSIKETDFKHVFAENKVLGDSSKLSSPYLSVKDANDLLLTDSQEAFLLPDGQPQDRLEARTLEHQQLPGVNNRHCMPPKPSKAKAVREADQDAIVQFCSLPPAQTKRLLILKSFEKMMLEQQPEQSFCFLDRNFVEEFKSKETMRQVLSQAQAAMLPDVVTQYYEMLDGLLLAMYHKNPPGRLIRNQWTFPLSSLPDFSDYHEIIKPQKIEIDASKLIDIENDRLGLVRTNEKMSFPSDNSII